MKHKVDFLRPKDFYFGEDWEEIFLQVKDIKKGDVFFECERYVNHKLTALTNARRISDGWYCMAETIDKKIVEIFVSNKTDHPGPGLFREPKYITELEKELVYMIE